MVFEITPEQIGPDLTFILPQPNNLYICNVLAYRGGFNLTTLVGYNTLTVEATDEVGVNTVEFSLDDGTSHIDNDTNDSTYIWDIVSWRIGEYQLTVTATNTKNISTTKTVPLRIICFGMFDNESNQTMPWLGRLFKRPEPTLKPKLAPNKHVIDPSPPSEPDDPEPTVRNRIEQVKAFRTSILNTLRESRAKHFTGFQLLEQLNMQFKNKLSR